MIWTHLKFLLSTQNPLGCEALNYLFFFWVFEHPLYNLRFRTEARKWYWERKLCTWGQRLSKERKWYFYSLTSVKEIAGLFLIVDFLGIFLVPKTWSLASWTHPSWQVCRVWSHGSYVRSKESTVHMYFTYHPGLLRLVQEVEFFAFAYVLWFIIFINFSGGPNIPHFQDWIT